MESEKKSKACKECGCLCDTCSPTNIYRPNENQSIKQTIENKNNNKNYHNINANANNNNGKNVNNNIISNGDNQTQHHHHQILHLYQEIEDLKRQIAERDYHIVQMETSVMNGTKQYPNGELEAIEETLRFWQEKHNRLFESHRKLQKVNQALEDKLLLIVDKFETEKASLTKDVTELTSKLVDARLLITDLEEENERYRNDCNIAIQLLHCKPSNFVAHKLDTLPNDMQDKVRLHFEKTTKRSKSIPTGLYQMSNMNPSNNNVQVNINNTNEDDSLNGGKVIRVPMPTFPPTAMFYSVNNESTNINNSNNESNNHFHTNVPTISETPDYVSAAIMAKVLEERSKERHVRLNSRYQKCFQCRNRRINHIYSDESSQTSNAQLNSEDFQTYPWIYLSDDELCKNRSRTESSSSTNSFESIGHQTTPIGEISQSPQPLPKQQQQQYKQQQQSNAGDQYFVNMSKKSNETIII